MTPSRAPPSLVLYWLLQVPLVVFTEYMRKKLKRDEAGNVVFWCVNPSLGATAQMTYDKLCN
jgi:hypothetical protein